MSGIERERERERNTQPQSVTSTALPLCLSLSLSDSLCHFIVSPGPHLFTPPTQCVFLHRQVSPAARTAIATGDDERERERERAGREKNVGTAEDRDSLWYPPTFSLSLSLTPYNDLGD